MPFYITLFAYLTVGCLIAYFIRVDVIDNRRIMRRNAQLAAELRLSKRQIAALRRNSLSSLNEYSDRELESQFVA